MTIEDRIKAFASLGSYLRDLTGPEFDFIAEKAVNENPWFRAESVRSAIQGITRWLSVPELTEWTGHYPSVVSPKQIAIVMAGNIPLVGFHDFLAVLISGHTAIVKLSSKDQFLTKFMIEKIVSIEPRFESRIILAERLKSYDAVIATGSDNSARYFEYYFGKYPHIIRKNRSSIAILNDHQTNYDLQELGKDVFTYYGLGCRNVSKLLVPKDFDFSRMFENWVPFEPIIHHHKYVNNYDYQKSILLINREKFLDNGFVLLKESQGLVSPISVLFYENYESQEDLKSKLDAVEDKVQVVVGNSPYCEVGFGEAQMPGLMDYADKVDTMKFLASL